MVSPSIVVIVDATTSQEGGGVPHPASFTTSMALDRSKHPIRSAALAPTSAPDNPSSKLRCQIKQTPASLSSRENILELSISRMVSEVSVKTHALLAPVALAKVTVIGSSRSSSTHIVVDVVESDKVI